MNSHHHRYQSRAATYLQMGLALVIGIALFVLVSTAINAISGAVAGFDAPSNPDIEITTTP